MKFSNCLSVLLQTSAVLGSSFIFSHNADQVANDENNLAKLESSKDFEYLLYDKLKIDDYVSIDDIEFAKLSELQSKSQNFLTDKNNNNIKNGHLVIMVKGDTPHDVKKMFHESSIQKVFNVDGKVDVDEKKVLGCLMNKYPELEVKLAQDNMKIISNVKTQDSKYSDSHMLFGNTEELSMNAKSVLQLSFLLRDIFPENVLSVTDDNDKTFGVLEFNLEGDDGEDEFERIMIFRMAFRLIHQAEFHGIESTLIVTGDTGSKNHRGSKKCHGKQTMTKRDFFATKPVFSKQSSFASEEECISYTNNCNTHGACSKNSLTTKWSCICSPSFNKTSKSTTHWGGSSCEKIDVSAEFNLLFWSCLVMIITVIGSIGLIFKMDSEPLPGILSAATNQNFKN
ncbi:hypothetical protein DASC09_060820 [Saccharomycopsis crataegensis]|uniref:Vacuolar sorting protein Vps3844 C-terminal domain-containing protein n=1 Tax=Saccharomycopsis crataegensis TaxID=43959 RepID=A0AAV5QXB2_9ASCO|nr:hypothetical protein DASC09_060820 [Saccharomycopsis crataegensis]